MPYKLQDHWNYVKKLLETFDSRHPQASCQDQADLEAYKIARKVTDDMLAKGLEIESLSGVIHPQKKTRLGKEMDTIYQAFGEDEIPAVKGPLSLAFVNEVFLPHLKESQKVIFTATVIAAGNRLGIDVAGKSQKSKLLAGKLDENIKIYLRANAELKSGLKNAIPMPATTHEPAQLKM